MLYINYIVILIVTFLKNSVIASNHNLDLKNVTSIHNYLKKIEQIAINDYKFEFKLNDKENKKILDTIYTDKYIIFNELHHMSAKFNDQYDDSEWTDVMSMIGVYGFKIKPAHMVHYFFNSESKISNLLKTIDTSMELFKSIGQMSSYSGSVGNFCNFSLPILNSFFDNLRRESIFKLYTKFIGRMVRTEMGSIISLQVFINC